MFYFLLGEALTILQWSCSKSALNLVMKMVLSGARAIIFSPPTPLHLNTSYSTFRFKNNNYKIAIYAPCALPQLFSFSSVNELILTLSNHFNSQIISIKYDVSINNSFNNWNIWSERQFCLLLCLTPSLWHHISHAVRCTCTNHDLLAGTGWTTYLRVEKYPSHLRYIHCLMFT